MPELFTVQQQIDEFRTKVELNSRMVDEIASKILSEYTKELDNLIKDVQKCVFESNDISDFEYETIALKLTTLMYWSSNGAELVGIRSDIAKAFEKEKYNKIYNSLVGTAKERESIATLETQAEYVVNIASTRAYKMLQAKTQNAYELLAVIKKILTRRLEQRKLPEI